MIKSKHNKNLKTPELVTFPYLAEWVKDSEDPFIVLFSSTDTGTVIRSKNEVWSAGDQNSDWCHCPGPYWRILEPTETVTLQNT